MTRVVGTIGMVRDRPSGHLCVEHAPTLIGSSAIDRRDRITIGAGDRRSIARSCGRSWPIEQQDVIAIERSAFIYGGT